MQCKPENEVEKANIAFLEDRISVNEGRPQIYGTQFHKGSNGQMQARQIRDVKNIERRCKSMGLETFEEDQVGIQ